MTCISKIKWFKLLFFMLLVKPIVLIALGLNLVNRHKLPTTGPAIIAANHTSHLDTLVLMSLYPLSQLHNVRPVAAADYFLRNRWMRWFSVYCLDIIPMYRHERITMVARFAPCYQALEAGQILILFPEGTRALTEDRIFKLKRGLHVLVQHYPQAQVTPVLLRGLGKALPKGEALFVPFNCDVLIDDPLSYQDNAQAYLANLESRYESLLSQCITK